MPTVHASEQPSRAVLSYRGCHMCTPTKLPRPAFQVLFTLTLDVTNETPIFTPLFIALILHDFQSCSYSFVVPPFFRFSNVFVWLRQGQLRARRAARPPAARRSSVNRQQPGDPPLHRAIASCSVCRQPQRFPPPSAILNSSQAASRCATRLSCCTHNSQPVGR